MAIDERIMAEPTGLLHGRTHERSTSRQTPMFGGSAKALRATWKQARRNPPAAVAALFVLLVTVAAIFAPIVTQHSPLAISPLNRLQLPSGAHLMGTDNLGRDVFTRVVYGARTSLIVGASVMLIGGTLGTLIGLATGYFGGLLDMVMQRVMDAVQAFPGLIFALALIAVLGASTMNVILAIVFFGTASSARVMRSAVLRVKGLDYIQASRSIGSGNFRIMMRDILPNIIGPLTIIATTTFEVAILAEAGLSFLGLGVPPPNPSWGNMLTGAGRQFMEQRPTLALFPGLTLSLTVLSLNLVGDGLTDFFNPRTRKA